MKKLILSWVAMVAVSGLSFGEAGVKSPMQEVKDAMFNSYSSGSLPEGFSDEELDVHSRPKLSVSLRQKLRELEEKSVRRFRKYAKSSGEYEYLGQEKFEALLKNPAEGLEVRYLIEIGEVYAVYKGEQLVGYVYDCADHGRAAEIQDGSGLVIYVDAEGNVIGYTRWDA